ncbi:uncharacterized protein LOC110609948 isoform X2 [Manihot esculenta]|uniref:DDT domain-containing protein n=1 Tax=Manihot esculenta TaxID=3983 RepID=A0A2C9WDU3_MANES|nr:uncharacterized protein LOC110609948 isoform X2 [Manihot esculenta]OAY57054.1 hypothetical protein MANES_02G066800v8 [Manihot esculenta]
MAVTSSGPDLNGEVATQEEKGLSNCNGVRLIGSRIYDSQNGKTCHQCRQKTRDFAAGCKNQKGNKQCPIKYCHKCLLNRYGEKAEEVALIDEWKCPKCRGICNCSLCMKKRGHKPTGILVHTAKENGFSSVSELLQVKGPENFGIDRTAKDASVSSKKPASTKESRIASPRKPGKENSFGVSSDLNEHSPNLILVSNRKSKKMRREELLEVNHSTRDDDGGVDASSGKSGQKSTLTKEVSKNKGKIIEEGKSVLIEKNKSKTQHKETPKKEVKKNGKHEGAIVEEKKSKTQFQDISKKEATVNKKAAGNFFEKKKLKTQMLKDVPVSHTANEERDAENFKNGVVLSDVQIDKLESKNMAAVEVCKINKCTVEHQSKQNDDSIPLPLSTCLTTVAGIELPRGDAGDALQFFEFCAAFSEVLDLKKGQAEAVIREIIFGRRARRSQGSLLTHFHIKLLLLIQEDIGEESPALSPANGKNSWLQALAKCVSKCKFISTGLPSDCFDRGNEGYDMLSTSQKFKLLNFLCDEALNTKALRSWIDDQNSKFTEREKEAKEKVLAAKVKEKQLKEKVQDEVAKAIIAKAKNDAPFSVSEYEAIVSQIKKEAAEARAEIMEAMGMVPKKRQRSDAVRTDPILLDVNGHAFWRLKGYNNEPDILLQDLGSWASAASEEKWFVYDAEQKQGIEKYISSLRTKRLRIQKDTETPLFGDDQNKLAV